MQRGRGAWFAAPACELVLDEFSNSKSQRGKGGVESVTHKRHDWRPHQQGWEKGWPDKGWEKEYDETGWSDKGWEKESDKGWWLGDDEGGVRR